MQRIYSHPIATMVHQVKNVLKNHGIDTQVRRENLANASGGIAPNEAWVELWLIDEKQLQEAERIVEDIINDTETENASPWTCPNCGEKIEGQFAACWNCGTEEP